MNPPRTSRELAERVEIDSQRHPNRFRHTTWWTALAIGIVAFAWVGIEFLRGEQRLYEAGPVATAHKMFENDCAKCHTEWSLGKRFLTMNDAVKSVSNEKCLACHDGPPHFVVAPGAHGAESPADPHREIACAVCHREHSGKAELAKVANKHCVTCHADLSKVHAGDIAVENNIQRFDDMPGEGGHPRFAIERLLASPPNKSDVPAAHTVHDLVKYLERTGPYEKDRTPHWQDAARIRFNHAVHLQPGLIGKDGKPLGSAKKCSDCHELDAGRRYMLPINYKKHCAECHPLHFDARYPADVVPHPSGVLPGKGPEIVRGFLTDFYAQRWTAKDDAPAEQNPRPRPGQETEADRKENRKAKMRQKVEAAEQVAQLYALDDFTPHNPLNHLKRSGGCAYCHEMTVPADKTLWNIVPPEIPARWLRYSRFQHDPHRIVACTECHRINLGARPVAEGASTEGGERHGPAPGCFEQKVRWAGKNGGRGEYQYGRCPDSRN